MPEEKDPPRPHGDKLQGSARPQRNTPEDNQAQVQSDAPPDVVGSTGAPFRDESATGDIGGPGSPVREESDRDRGRGSTANGVPVFDEDDGALRKRQYRDGADLVSGLD
jgi:hypothetical protein